MDKLKILYVDSHKEYGKKYLSYLLNKNCDVKYMDSMKDALIEYSFQKPNVLITDIKLADGSGLELIEKIKKIDKKIKTVVLTDDADKQIFLDTIALKIDKLFFKSQSFDEIQKEIQKLNILKNNKDKDVKDLVFDLGDNYLYESQSFISKDGDIIELTLQENNLIKELIKANGECVDYKILQTCIGKEGQSTIETLRTVIKKIRKKTYNEIIQNQSGMGYKVNYCYDIDILRKFKINKYTMIDAKILILKGNNKKNDLLSYKLTKFGFKCESVNTITGAKELLSIEKFDYVISDLNLPDGDGIDFIRSIDDLNATKVIILSAIEDMHYKDYLYFKGIIDYILDAEDPSYLAYTIYKTIFKIESNTRFNNVLVIESSKRICEQIKDLLLPRNYMVDILNDLSQAYELIKIKSYSLVILGIDYNNSFDFLNDVKSRIDKNLPFIILSDSHRTYSTVREAYKNGASECLRKPLFAEEFILKVDQLVDGTKLLQEVMAQKKILDDYKKIVDQSTIMSKADTKGIITYANNMFCQISGYSQDELIGKNHNIIHHPSIPKETLNQMWKTIKEEGKIWNGIVKNRTKEGDEYIVQTTVLPLKNAEGEIVEFIALRNDITSIYKENNENKTKLS